MNATYDYAQVSATVLDAAQGYLRAAEEHGVSLSALALQFALRHPAITSVVVGARTADEIGLDVDGAASPIPDDVWHAVRQ
jgi:D-threo-aldose 1-dehydrogenase